MFEGGIEFELELRKKKKKKKEEEPALSNHRSETAHDSFCSQ